MHQGAQKARTGSSFSQNGIPKKLAIVHTSSMQGKQPLFPYKQGPPLSKESQQYYSEIQKYLRKIYNIQTFSLGDMQKKKANVLKMVPLVGGQKEEKTIVEQKRQRA